MKIYEDLSRSISYLGIEAISKESADQRLGRCNGTGSGICYRLYSKDIYNELPSQIPDICRSDLSQVFFQLLSYNKDIFKLDLLDYPTCTNAIDGLKFLMRKKCVKVIGKGKEGRC